MEYSDIFENDQFKRLFARAIREANETVKKLQKDRILNRRTLLKPTGPFDPSGKWPHQKR